MRFPEKEKRPVGNANNTFQSYTTWQARQDIQFLGGECDGLRTTQTSMQADLDQLTNDEFRALYQIRILKQRVDILERLVMKMLPPEDRKMLTHLIITELRTTKQSETKE